MRRAEDFKPSSRILLASESGQSTIEFALTMVLTLAFTFFYIQLCFFFAFGNYIHYATFMSARAYLSAGPNPEDQAARARAVIVRMLKKSEGFAGVDRFPAIAKGIGGGDPTGFQLDPAPFSRYVRDLSWLEGVRYKFRGRLFVIPLAGIGRGSADPNANSVTLTSESFLLREPSTEECQGFIEKKNAIYDNGC